MHGPSFTQALSYVGTPYMKLTSRKKAMNFPSLASMAPATGAMKTEPEPDLEHLDLDKPSSAISAPGPARHGHHGQNPYQFKFLYAGEQWFTSPGPTKPEFVFSM